MASPWGPPPPLPGQQEPPPIPGVGYQQLHEAVRARRVGHKPQFLTLEQRRAEKRRQKNHYREQRVRLAGRTVRTAALVDGVATVRQELGDWASKFYADPVGFADFAFPWGVKGTELEHYPNGLRSWQREYLQWLGEQVLERGFDGIEPVAPIRKSVASGHGIGKSALVSIIILWMMVTRPFCKGTVTATTNNQLRVKTWAELAKWHKRCVYASWFEVGALSQLYIRHRKFPANWRCDGQTCAEHNSEAFAGQHEVSSTSFYIFDEASGVPNPIWTVGEGGLTDGEPFFLVFGNPTQHGGSFAETQGRYKELWSAVQIDSRMVEGTNKKLFQEWADQWGVDSDFFRVRVRGLPPRQAANQFIPVDYVFDAQQRELPDRIVHPVIMGVDVARGESDNANESVIVIRQGADARRFPIGRWDGVDNVQLAGHIVEWAERYDVDAIFIDSTGVGGGVYDILATGRWPVYPVVFGGRANDAVRYANKRAECYGEMREWMRTVGCIPAPTAPTVGGRNDAVDLETQLTGIWSFVRLNGQRIMEAKIDMEERGLESPDISDALSNTFAERLPVDFRSKRHAGRPGFEMDGRLQRRPRGSRDDVNYDPTTLV